MYCHGKPIRSSAPGPKFSTITSDSLISFSSTSLPSGFFVSSVSEFLLLLSIVKYSASTSGLWRNWLRVTSPEPGRSTLITSAPNHASNCVQAGPACTCVKSMILIPSSGLLMIFLSPDSLAKGLVTHVLACGDTGGTRCTFRRYRRTQLLFHRCTLWIQIGQAAALRARCFVDDGIDECRLARRDGFLQRLRQLFRPRVVVADSAECFDHLVVARALDEHRRGNVLAAGRVHVGAAIHAVVVEDNRANRQVIAADGFQFHAAEAERAIAFDRRNRLAARHPRPDGKPHANAPN